MVVCLERKWWAKIITCWMVRSTLKSFLEWKASLVHTTELPLFYLWLLHRPSQFSGYFDEAAVLLVILQLSLCQLQGFPRDKHHLLKPALIGAWHIKTCSGKFTLNSELNVIELKANNFWSFPQFAEWQVFYSNRYTQGHSFQFSEVTGYGLSED